MSNIPLARSKLLVLMHYMPAGVSKRVASEVMPLLTRESPIRRASTRAERITPEIARRVRAYARRHPDATTQQIAVRFKLRNGGRVSEILNGKRGL